MEGAVMSKKKRKSRKKPARRRKSKMQESVEPTDLSMPDPRVMEGVLRQFLGDSGMIDESDSALAEAQDLVYQAYDVDDLEERLELASDAIDICPDCADAFVCIAEIAPSPNEAATMYRLGMEAGERALGGPEAFGEYEGHFWGIMETRPYMRARLGLAQCQWAVGQRDEAVDHCRELLHLNPNDNQGVRYILCSYYCDLGRNDDLQQLLDEYEDDGSAEWLFSQAFAAFCQEGDTDGSRRLLCEAHDTNPHVAKYLLGHEQLPVEMPEYVERGGESEAVGYAANFLTGWRAAAGSVSWLRKTLKLAPPEPPYVRRPSWKFLKGSVSELPLAEGETWQVDLRRTTIGVPPGEDMELPWTFIVTSAETDDIVALGTPEDDAKPSPNQVLLNLLAVMRSPQDGEPRRPEHIQVRLKTYLNQWQSKLKQIDVQCERCENLDHVDLMIDRLASMGGSPRLATEELESRISELDELPQNLGEVWQADIRKLSTWIEAEGELLRPSTALVTNRTDDLIIAQDVGIQEPNTDWLRQTLLAAMLNPMVGDPHLPGTLQVVSERYRDELLPLLDPLDIACVACDELDQLDFIFGEMHRSMAESDQPPALIDVPGVTPSHVRGFFEAAATYYERTPWRDVAGDLPILVRCAKFETGTWYAVVMGQSGMTLGLAMYEDLDVLRAIIREEDDVDRRHSALSVMYSEPFEIAVRDLDAAESNGWPVAGPEAYPMILRVNPGMAVRPPLAWELELTEACLRALPVFVTRGTKTPARMTVPIATGELDLELTWVQ